MTDRIVKLTAEQFAILPDVQELSFAECVEHFAKLQPELEHYRQRAWELFHEDGEIEIDECAVVSLGEDPGAYVMAWVWVPARRAQRKKARKGKSRERAA